MVLQSERMSFYPISIIHLKDVAIFLADDEVRRNMRMPTLNTREKLHAWFDRFEEERHAGRVIQWVGYLRENAVYTCLLTLKEIDWANHRAELGYSVNPALWHKGLASETAALGVKYAFETLDLHTLTAQILPDNLASQRVVTKLGFTQEAHFKDAILFEGQYYDLLQFSKINPAHLSC